jgi:hypothetical protein
MVLNEEVITYLEAHIPDMVNGATKQAYWQTLASGDSVLVSEDGHLVEVFPDGTRKIIKKIDALIPIEAGKKINIK